MQTVPTEVSRSLGPIRLAKKKKTFYFPDLSGCFSIYFLIYILWLKRKDKNCIELFGNEKGGAG